MYAGLVTATIPVLQLPRINIDFPRRNTIGKTQFTIWHCVYIREKVLIDISNSGMGTPIQPKFPRRCDREMKAKDQPAPSQLQCSCHIDYVIALGVLTEIRILAYLQFLRYTWIHHGEGG